MAVVVGCKCDCPIVGFVRKLTRRGWVVVRNQLGWPIAIKAHNEQCPHRMCSHLQLQGTVR